MEIDFGAKLVSFPNIQILNVSCFQHVQLFELLLTAVTSPRFSKVCSLDFNPLITHFDKKTFMHDFAHRSMV